MKLKLITGIALAAALPLGANAYVTPVQERSASQCEHAVQQQMDNAHIRDTFHRSVDGGQEIYFNVVTFRNGERQEQRVTCATTPSGNRVTDLRAEAGRWVEGRG